jgi:hypothetical protein
MVRAFKAASTRILPRSTGLSKTTGWSNLLLPLPGRFVPPRLKEGVAAE